MKRIFTIAAVVLLAAAASGSPMVPYSSIPGPMVPSLSGPMVPNGTGGGGPVGCTMNGVLDLTNTCNDIYILTGMF